MLAASSVTSREIVLLLMVDLSTLLARPATNVVRLVIFLATAHKRLPMVSCLAMLVSVPLQWLHLSLLLLRSAVDLHCLIGHDELLSDAWFGHRLSFL